MKNKYAMRIVKSDEADMKIAGLFPEVDLAVALIARGASLLAVYNENWGSFTLPMSKIRERETVRGEDGRETPENGRDAAVRAALEWLGRTVTEPVEPVATCGEFLQSERDGQWKRYRVWVFRIPVADNVEPVSGKISEWLRPEQFQEPDRKTVSPTARHILEELQVHGKL